MKDLNDFIIERGAAHSRNFKYCINVLIKDFGWNKLMSDNWEQTISEEPVTKAEYWDVMDMNKGDFATPDALIAWHGEGGYWANVYNDSKNPENCPSWATVFKGKDLEKIESCKQ